MKIVYIHGLNSSSASMWPFKWYIGEGVTVSYDSVDKTFDDIVSQVYEEILNVLDFNGEELILVGWSLGGL